MKYQYFLFILFVSCSQKEVVENTCLPKLKEIRQSHFSNVSDRDLANSDNILKLSRIAYGPRYFSEMKSLEKDDLTCAESFYKTFSFAKAVINELRQYDNMTQKKIINDLKKYIEFRVDFRKNTVSDNMMLFALLRKSSRKGFFQVSRNRILNKMREADEQLDQIKGIKNPEEAKVKEEILYQTSRDNILEILKRG